MPDNGADVLRVVNVLDYAVVFARHKRFLLRFVGATVALAAIVLFLLFSRWYKSTAVVMPPKQKSTLNLLSSLSRATAPLRSLGIGPAAEELADLQTILASRRLKEAVVHQFELLKVYDLDTMEKAVKELAENMAVTPGEEDASLEIVVYDTDPRRAADMANFMVTTLNQVYLELSVTEAKSNREFLQKRYDQNLSDLRAAEDSLRGFQERYGVYSVPDQVKAAVEAAATLESRAALQEVKLGILAQTASSDHPERRATELELRELRRRLAEMKAGGQGGRRSLVFPSFDKAPEVGIEYLRRYRELELQAKLLEVLLPLYEQAKIEEQRNTPSVLVLDTAVPAVRHAKPKRMLLLAAVAVVALLLGFLIALVRERMGRVRGTLPEATAAKMEFIRRELAWKNLFR